MLRLKVWLILCVFLIFFQSGARGARAFLRHFCMVHPERQRRGSAMLTRDFFETDRIRKLFEARHHEGVDQTTSIPEIPRPQPLSSSAESSLSSIRNVRSISVQPEQKSSAATATATTNSTTTAQQHRQPHPKSMATKPPHGPRSQQQKHAAKAEEKTNKHRTSRTSESRSRSDNKDVLKVSEETGIRRGSDVSTISLHGRTSPTYL